MRAACRCKHAPAEVAMADQGFSRMRMLTTHSGETYHDQPKCYTADAVLVAIDIAKACNEVLIEA